MTLIREGLPSNILMSPQVYRQINSICRWPFSFLGLFQKQTETITLRGVQCLEQEVFGHKALAGADGCSWGSVGSHMPQPLFPRTAHPVHDPNWGLNISLHVLNLSG